MESARANTAAGSPRDGSGLFRSPRIAPAIGRHRGIVRYATGLEGLCVAALARRICGGSGTAAANGAHKVTLPFSMSESHSLKNLKQDSLPGNREIRTCVEFLRSLPAQQAATV